MLAMTNKTAENFTLRMHRWWLRKWSVGANWS